MELRDTSKRFKRVPGPKTKIRKIEVRIYPNGIFDPLCVMVEGGEMDGFRRHRRRPGWKKEVLGGETCCVWKRDMLCVWRGDMSLLHTHNMSLFHTHATCFSSTHITCLSSMHTTCLSPKHLLLPARATTTAAEPIHPTHPPPPTRRGGQISRSDTSSLRLWIISRLGFTL